MRAWLSIFFLFLYLMVNTEMRELILIPTMVSHYMDHKKQDDNLSFAHFIILHYFSPKGDDDPSAHANLPFRHNYAKHFTFNFFPERSPEIIPSNTYTEMSFCVQHDFLVSSHKFSSIWQPPRLVIA